MLDVPDKVGLESGRPKENNGATNDEMQRSNSDHHNQIKINGKFCGRNMEGF